MTDDAVAAWFVREIVPLEATLMHYLQHNWRNASDIPDLRQEVYVRVLQAAREQVPDNPKHFLLVCARNLLIDRIRREQVVPMETFADLDVLGLADDAPQLERVLTDRENSHRLEASLERLPPRTRQAIALAYFEGLSNAEIARRMGIKRQVASRLVARGIAALGDILFGRAAGRSSKQ